MINAEPDYSLAKNLGRGDAAAPRPAPQPPLTARVLAGIEEATKFLNEATNIQVMTLGRVFGPYGEAGDPTSADTPSNLEGQIAERVANLIELARRAMHNAQAIDNRL